MREWNLEEASGSWYSDDIVLDVLDYILHFVVSLLDAASTELIERDREGHWGRGRSLNFSFQILNSIKLPEVASSSLSLGDFTFTSEVSLRPTSHLLHYYILVFFAFRCSSPLPIPPVLTLDLVSQLRIWKLVMVGIWGSNGDVMQLQIVTRTQCLRKHHRWQRVR